MKRYVSLFLAVLLLTLTACTGGADATNASETIAALETTEVPDTAAAMETTAIPTEAPTPSTVPTEIPTEVMEEPQILPPQPGYYLVSSVGRDGDVTFYGSLDPSNGYVKLNEDNTGFIHFEGAEGELTWDTEAIYWQNQTLYCAYMTYFDSELGQEDGILMIYFLDPLVSVALRAAEEPAGE